MAHAGSLGGSRIVAKHKSHPMALWQDRRVKLASANTSVHAVVAPIWTHGGFQRLLNEILPRMYSRHTVTLFCSATRRWNCNVDVGVVVWNGDLCAGASCSSGSGPSRRLLAQGNSSREAANARCAETARRANHRATHGRGGSELLGDGGGTVLRQEAQDLCCRT